jgi:hypothetical protein
MIEVLQSSYTWVVTRAIRRNIPEGGILQFVHLSLQTCFRTVLTYTVSSILLDLPEVDNILSYSKTASCVGPWEPKLSQSNTHCSSDYYKYEDSDEVNQAVSDEDVWRRDTAPRILHLGNGKAQMVSFTSWPPYRLRKRTRNTNAVLPIDSRRQSERKGADIISRP